MNAAKHKLMVRGKLVPATYENVKEAVRESYEQVLSSDANITVTIGREPTRAEREAMELASSFDLAAL